ncbi:MAG: SLC13 family permease, partial [Boseongicola sp. SB0676_bin_33]|nr:SLC13 family permease [Boseongicola sp. SB0676_bin_33]
MPEDQALILAIFAVLFALLAWGRIRYDLVAFGALVLAAMLGLVPRQEMFSGFGHSAVAVIALVLVISRGLIGSGAIEKLAAGLLDSERALPM